MKKFLFKLTGLITTLFLLTVFSSIDVYCTSTAEREALIALYNSTDGPNWTNSDGWLLDDMPCGWYGITCSESYIQKIILIIWSIKNFFSILH